MREVSYLTPPPTLAKKLIEILTDGTRYIIHPSYVVSKDGYMRYVDHPAIASRYGLSRGDYIVGDWSDYTELKGDIHLWYRVDGNYTLPKAGDST